MEYKKLEEINNKLKSVDIKGKDYVEVNERLKAFWNVCEEGKIKTKILSLENGIVVIQAEIYENKLDPEPRATGIAYEKEGSTFINKTSYIENCETSAIGRALGIAGIGINTSVASAEEVQNAIVQQEQPKTINATMISSLREMITNLGVSDEEVINALKELKCKKLAELTYDKVEQFRKIISK